MTAPSPHPDSVPDEDWAHRDPPFLVPVPARLEQPLCGRRLVLHDPSVPCWRYDVVGIREADADNKVGVLDQHDYYRYYRAARNDERVAGAAVSIDYLWVERDFPEWSSIPDEMRPPRVDVPVGLPHLPPSTWLEHPIQPPIRQMRAANETRGRITVGTRAALRQSIGLLRGLRVISAPHLYNFGTPNLAFGLDEIDQPLYQQSITVCEEEDYFVWIPGGGNTPPSAEVYPLGAILLE